MAMAEDSGDRTTKWLRWLARGLGTLAAAFWLFSLIASGLGDAISRVPLTLEGAVLGALVIVAVVGVALAWWREEIGGTIMVIKGIDLCIFAYVTAGHSKGFAMAVSGGPFLLAGILFLATWAVSTFKPSLLD